MTFKQQDWAHHGSPERLVVAPALASPVSPEVLQAMVWPRPPPDAFVVSPRPLTPVLTPGFPSPVILPVPHAMSPRLNMAAQIASGVSDMYLNDLSGIPIPSWRDPAVIRNHQQNEHMAVREQLPRQQDDIRVDSEVQARIRLEQKNAILMARLESAEARAADAAIENQRLVQEGEWILQKAYEEAEMRVREVQELAHLEMSRQLQARVEPRALRTMPLGSETGYYPLPEATTKTRKEDPPDEVSAPEVQIAGGQQELDRRVQIRKKGMDWEPQGDSPGTKGNLADVGVQAAMMASASTQTPVTEPIARDIRTGMFELNSPHEYTPQGNSVEFRKVLAENSGQSLAVPRAEGEGDRTARHREKEPARAYIGLQVTNHLPHAITGVDDLMDEHLVRQGEPGYANPTVHVGDLILQVDGKPSTHVTVQEMHHMLRGQINTPVEVTLARAHHPSEKYTIRVMRHRFHQVDSFDENSGRQSPYMQPGESEGFWWNREGPIKEIAGPTHWVGEARAGGTHALTDRAPLAGSAKDLYHHYGQHRHQRHPEGLVEVDEDGQASVSILVYFCICWYRCEPCRIYSKPARLWKV